jgi:hypothetical protein
MDRCCTIWLPLRALKYSNPIETAEYAVEKGLDQEVAFRWCVKATLQKRDQWVMKVKTRCWKRIHKYGIELPKSVHKALAIDARTSTTFWRDSTAKEMKTVMPAFQFRDNDQVPRGYTKIACHMIFDVKVDLIRKTRLVAGGPSD